MAAAIEKIKEGKPHENGFLAVLERAILSPDMPLDKLEKLLDIQERVMRKDAETEFNIAMSNMQPLLPTIDKNGAIKFTDKNGNEQFTQHPKYEDIIEAIKPFMADNGFSLSFSMDREADRVIITGKLAHRSGHCEKVTLPLPLDSSGSKNNIQAVGSSLTYGRRYAVDLLLNIVSRGQDDDGMKGGAKPISDEQTMIIYDWLESTGADKAAFLKYMKVASVEEIPTARYQVAINALQAKAKGRAAK